MVFVFGAMLGLVGCRNGGGDECDDGCDGYSYYNGYYGYDDPYCNGTNGSTNGGTNGTYNGGTNGNGKIPDPGGEFEYSTIIVSLTVEASLTDKEWAPSHFPEFAFSEIIDIGIIGSRRVLGFLLLEPSRNNVLRAIYVLRARSEIFSAEPDWLGDGG